MKRALSPFGKAIKKALVDKGMSQEELAVRIGTSAGYLGFILYGERSGTKYRKAILQELGIKEKGGTDSAAS